MSSILLTKLHALAVVLALTPAALAAEEPPPKKSERPAGGDREAAEAPHGYFQRAWHYETAEGKVEEALAMYRGLAALADSPRRAARQGALPRRDLPAQVATPG